MKTFGNGGLFSFTGYFYVREHGTVRAFVNDWSRCVIIGTTEDKIAIAPDNPNEFIAALNARRATL